MVIVDEDEDEDTQNVDVFQILAAEIRRGATGIVKYWQHVILQP